ncbi:hypothetical protein PLEOSDRAFT_1016085, partial [Pleurotus ostreatus PC15]
DEAQESITDHWTYPRGIRPPEFLDEEILSKAHLLVAFTPRALEEWKESYAEDAYFKEKFEVSESEDPERLLTSPRFRKGANGLLYFVDADWRHRLCVPRGQVPSVLRQIHESPYESAHEGAR